jgi:hypothetical protein
VTASKDPLSSICRLSASISQACRIPRSPSGCHAGQAELIDTTMLCLRLHAVTTLTAHDAYRSQSVSTPPMALQPVSRSHIHGRAVELISKPRQSPINGHGRQAQSTSRRDSGPCFSSSAPKAWVRPSPSCIGSMAKVLPSSPKVDGSGPRLSHARHWRKHARSKRLNR